MKLYKNDLFQKNKFKSYLTILVFIFIVFFILRDNLNRYFLKYPNSNIHILFSSIINLDGTKILKLITSVFRDIVKDITKFALHEMNLFTNQLVELNNLLVKLSNIMNASNLNFFDKYTGLKTVISNTMLPIFKSMFNIRDLLKKVTGVLTTVLYTILSGIMSNSALLGSLTEIITSLLVMVIPIIVLSYIANFPLAMVLTSLYIAVSIPMIIVATETGKIYDLTSRSRNFKSKKIKKIKRHRHSHCFHKDTEIETKNGIKKIIDLKVDDYIKIKNSFVKITGLTKHCGKDQEFYNINDILVTKNHYIKHNNNWIKVFKHPNAIKKNIDEDYVYCLTTKEKIIQIKNELFLDWDDFDEKAEQKSNIKKHDVDYYTGYLDENTLIKMNNSNYKKIKHIVIGDILFNKNKVLGKINLGTKQIYSYKIKNNIIMGCKNLIYYENNEKISTLKKNICNSPFIGNCIQIFTENKKINLRNNVVIGDYDTSLENLIY